MIASPHHPISFVDQGYRYPVVSQGYERVLNSDASDVLGKYISDIHGKIIFNDSLKSLQDSSLVGESVNT